MKFSPLSHFGLKAQLSPSPFSFSACWPSWLCYPLAHFLPFNSFLLGRPSRSKPAWMPPSHLSPSVFVSKPSPTLSIANKQVPPDRSISHLWLSLPNPLRYDHVPVWPSITSTDQATVQAVHPPPLRHPCQLIASPFPRSLVCQIRPTMAGMPSSIPTRLKKEWKDRSKLNRKDEI